MTQQPGWEPPEGGWPSPESWGPSPWGPWGRGGDFSRWRHGRGQWERHRGRLFLRFAATFGFIALLVLGSMAALAFLLTRLAGGDGQIAGLVWVGGCGLSLALPILALGLAVRAFRRIATPLAEVMSAADAVANGDLSVRVPVHGPGDFQRLAVSFNRMTAELARADQQRRNLTADVAHELRNPLHIIQGNLEGILDGVYEPTPEHVGATLEETRALARLVDDLNTLSLAEAGQLPMKWEPVDVPAFLADVSTSFSGPADAAGIVLTAVSTPGLSLYRGLGAAGSGAGQPRSQRAAAHAPWRHDRAACGAGVLCGRARRGPVRHQRHRRRDSCRGFAVRFRSLLARGPLPCSGRWRRERPGFGDRAATGPCPRRTHRRGERGRPRHDVHHRVTRRPS